MLLRKHLIGGKVASIHVPFPERVMSISFSPPDGLEAVELLGEIMGRRSNLVLINGDKYILGAARITTFERNRKRGITVGEKYLPVPKPDKLNPLTMTSQEFTQAFLATSKKEDNAEKALLSTVFGISPLLAKELTVRANESSANSENIIVSLGSETTALFKAGADGKLTPVVIPELNTYAPLKLRQCKNCRQDEIADINLLLDNYYRSIIAKNLEDNLKGYLGGAVEKRIAILTKKKQEQIKDRQSFAEADLYRKYGELLFAYGNNFSAGKTSISLPDLYDPECNINIPLEPSLTATANAQKYFNRYRKAKKGIEEIKKQLKKTEQEINYCFNLQYAINSGDITSLQEIRDELIESGYLRRRKTDKKKKTLPPQPLTFNSSSGSKILVGRNNKQNDFITFTLAKRKDTWFHVKDLPGSHVVIKEALDPPSDSDIREAAFLAAYFSRGREQKVITVDYTAVKHVRRRPAGKPGDVFYNSFQSVSVNPGDLDMINFFRL